MYSGITFDLPALFDERDERAAPARVPGPVPVVRGAPVWLLYRGRFAVHDRLPLRSVRDRAAAGRRRHAIGLEEGRMRPDNAAALVGAGMVSVLLFPLLALQLRGGRVVPNLDAAAQEGF